MKHLVLLVILLSPTTVLAQNEVSALTSFIAGRSESQGTLFRTPHLGLTFNHFWTDNWSTELGLFRSEETFETFELVRPVPPVVRSEDHEVYPITAAFQYHFFDKRWRPYVGGGLIYANAPGELPDFKLVDDDDILRLMLNFGINYSFSDKIGLRIDVKYSPIGLDGPTILEGFTPTLGVKVRF